MEFLIDIAIMVICAKLFADLFERFNLPELVGSITAGFILGPLLGIVEIEHIRPFGEIGLILLLFIAGFEEIRMEEILKHKTACFFIGLVSSLVPLSVGFLVGKLFEFSTMASLFLGVALMSTSISISLGSLLKTGRLNTRLGKITLGSSIIDDIIGLVGLSIIVHIGLSGTFPGFTDISFIFFEMFLFFIIFVVCAYLFPKFVVWSRFLIVEEARFSITLVLILLLAFLADRFGLSSVLGAFLAGVILSKVPELETKKFIEKVNVTSEGIFIPLFYAMIGMELMFSTGSVTLFTVVLIVAAILTKIVPTFIVARFSRLSSWESLGLGITTVPRGEVSLIIMILGRNLGIIPESLFVSFVLLIIVTTFFVPVALRPVMGRITQS